MARGFNALRAALGAVTGVAEGLQQRELLTEKRKREQAEADRLLRAEERQAVAAGMMEGDRLASMTMPGATPAPFMQPTLRQKIGEKEYVYAPGINAAEKHRADVMKKRETLAAKKGERSTVVTALEAVEAGNKTLPKEKAEAWAGLPSAERSARVKEWVNANTPKPAKKGKEELSDAEKERIGLQFIAAQSRNPALTAALQTSFSMDPESAQRPGLVAYDIKQSRAVPLLSAGRGYQAPRPTSKGRAGGRFGTPPGMPGSTPAATGAPKKDEFDLAIEGRK